MEDKELIKALRDYARACVNDNHYDFNPGIALIIANRMEQLVALAENGQSAIDTNKRLVAHIDNLQSQLDSAIQDVKTALNTDDVCSLCKYYTKCEDESCAYYMSGYGLTDEEGNYVHWPWSCEDFDWGKCPKLENTPCNGCDFINHFEWRGQNKIIENSIRTRFNLGDKIWCSYRYEDELYTECCTIYKIEIIKSENKAILFYGVEDEKGNEHKLLESLCFSSFEELQAATAYDNTK